MVPLALGSCDIPFVNGWDPRSRITLLCAGRTSRDSALALILVGAVLGRTALLLGSLSLNRAREPALCWSGPLCTIPSPSSLLDNFEAGSRHGCPSLSWWCSSSDAPPSACRSAVCNRPETALQLLAAQEHRSTPWARPLLSRVVADSWLSSASSPHPHVHATGRRRSSDPALWRAARTHDHFADR